MGLHSKNSQIYAVTKEQLSHYITLEVKHKTCKEYLEDALILHGRKDHQAGNILFLKIKCTKIIVS